MEHKTYYVARASRNGIAFSNAYRFPPLFLWSKVFKNQNLLGQKSCFKENDRSNLLQLHASLLAAQHQGTTSRLPIPPSDRSMMKRGEYGIENETNCSSQLKHADNDEEVICDNDGDVAAQNYIGGLDAKNNHGTKRCCNICFFPHPNDTMQKKSPCSESCSR